MDVQQTMPDLEFPILLRRQPVLGGRAYSTRRHVIRILPPPKPDPVNWLIVESSDRLDDNAHAIH
jgi:hypothetical protein